MRAKLGYAELYINGVFYGPVEGVEVETEEHTLEHRDFSGGHSGVAGSVTMHRNIVVRLDMSVPPPHPYVDLHNPASEPADPGAGTRKIKLRK